jgi:hypothetical protein
LLNDTLMAANLRREVLGLYGACMRSARKCPEWEQREMMKAYVRMKFRDEVRTKDTSRIQRMMADAREELAQMEYYHSVYEEKQRQRVTANSAGLKVPSPLGESKAMCGSCGHEFAPPQAKFCSNCGEKRL